MKKTFNMAVLKLIRKGIDPIEALEIIENSNEFEEEEIKEWFDKFNNRHIKKNIYK